MSDSIVFEKLIDSSSANSQGIIQMINDEFGLNHTVTDSIWDWEYNQIDDTVFTIARDGDQVIGTQAMLSIVIECDKGLIKTAKCETTHMSPKYRGRKIFERLFAFAVDDIIAQNFKLMWAFTHADKAFKKNLKFEVYNHSMNTIRIISGFYSPRFVLTKSRNIIFGIGKFLMYNTSYIGFLLRRNILSKSKVDIAVSNKIDTKAVNELYSRIRENNKELIHLNISENYFNWRVLGNPMISYKCLSFYKESELVGYLVYSLHGNSIVVADATFNLDNAVVEYMFFYLSKLHKDHYIIEYWGNPQSAINDKIFALLSKCGGKTVVDTQRNFVYKKCDDSLNGISFGINNWYINGLWTEGTHI